MTGRLVIWPNLMLVTMALRILTPKIVTAFLPAGSIGWIVSEEPFFAPIKKVVNYFKVRATLGMVGNDNYAGQRFLYLPGSYGYGQNNDHNGPGGFFWTEHWKCQAWCMGGYSE